MVRKKRASKNNKNPNHRRKAVRSKLNPFAIVSFSNASVKS